MSLLAYLIRDTFSILASLGVGLVSLLIYHVVTFYIRVRKYPKGPFPYPFVGNILLFRGQKFIHEAVLEKSKIYGPVFTIWMGTDPMVMICDSKHVIEAYRDRKNDFAGRPKFAMNDLFMEPGTIDVFMADWGREWEVLRRITHTAARKFAVNPSFPKIAVPIVDETIDVIRKDSKDFTEPIDLKEHVPLLIYSIIASSAFGKRYTLDDPEFIKIKSEIDEQNDLNTTFLILEYLPFMRFVYRKQMKRLEEIALSQAEIFGEKLLQHKMKFEGVKYGDIKESKNEMVADFIDALIVARLEAESEHEENLEYLKDGNFINVIKDFFFAGSETSRNTLMWMFLLMANYPEIQSKMRQEVEDLIEDQIPTNDHKQKCHYINAFISESMRFRGIVSLGIPHKAICDSSIGGQKILSGTTVIAIHHGTHHEKESWGDPEVFRPERFIEEDTGNHSTHINGAGTSFMPFSIGRRNCLGERLALINIFIILCRFLQQTKGYKLELEHGPGSVSLDGETAGTMFVPVPYRVKLMPVRNKISTTLRPSID